MASVAIPSVLVLGSGIIGLTVAKTLSDASCRVVVRSGAPSECKTGASQGAGGLWMPFHCEDPSTTRWSRQTLLSYLSHLSTPSSPLSPHINLTPTTLYKNDTDSYTEVTADVPGWANENPELEFQAICIEQLEWQGSISGLHIPPALKESYTDAWYFKTPIIDSPAYLSTLKSMLQTSGVDISESNPYPSPSSVLASASDLSCTYVINCTGLSTLLSDPALIPARGVLQYYKRPPSFRTCILVDDGPVGSSTHPVYAIPRGDLVAVGGTYLENDTETEVREEEREMLELNASTLLPGYPDGWEKVGEWAGFRPVREEGVKIGVNEDLTKDGVTWIDNYGHGGSGWTVAEGCADDVGKIIKGLT